MPRVERWMQTAGGAAFAQVPPEVERRAKLEAERVMAERAKAPAKRSGGGDPLEHLLARKAALVAEAKRLNEPTISRGRDFTPSELRRWKLITAEIDVVNDEIQAGHEAIVSRADGTALRRAMGKDPAWTWRVCIHESGHALGALLAGEEVGSVALIPASTGRVEGRYQPREQLGTFGTLAGAAAERVFLSDGELEGKDRRQVLESVKRDFIPAELASVTERLRPEAGAIKALAAVLQERGQVSPSDTREILVKNLSADGARDVSRLAGRTAYLRRRA